MGGVLAGVTFLIIGASQFAHDGYLISTLHRDLMERGASVVTYGACATFPHSWITPEPVKCGSAIHIGAGLVEEVPPPEAMSFRVTDLIHQYHPQVVLIGIADTMADYRKADLPTAWIRQEVGELARTISAEHVSCIWLGTSWGSEGGKFQKTYSRVRALSDVLAASVAPCEYIDSLMFSTPGEWPTIDGQHHTNVGYELWGKALAGAIEESATIKSLKSASSLPTASPLSLPVGW